MSLDHDFLLLDRETDGEWELTRFIHDPRSIHLHDDLIEYMWPALNWVPTFNPARREPHRGLCMHGVTIIGTEGAGIAERVFRAWAHLFSLGPPVLVLPSTWVMVPDARREAPLEYVRPRFECERDHVVGVLRQLAQYTERVRSAGDRLYLLPSRDLST